MESTLTVEGSLWGFCILGSNPGQGKSAVGVHAIGLNSWTGTEGSPVSSLKCDRW